MSEPPLDPPNYGPSYPDDPYGSFQPPPAEPPPGPPGGTPASAAAKLSFADRVGSRVLRRPEPRFGVALAGIGILLMIFGILVWAGSYAGSGGGGGGSESHKLLGIALSLVAVAAGYALAIRQRTGPLVTAGVAASAVGMPVLMGFLSFSTSGSSGSPFSFDAVAIVSIVVWLISYFFIPVVRGHVFYLGASAVLLWIYILDKAESHLFSISFLLDRLLLGAPNDGIQFGGGGGGGIDPNNIAALSLVFGLAYYMIAAILDRNGRSGAAVAFAVGGFPAMVTGLVAAAVNMPQVGEGFLIIAIGLLVAATAGRGRRFTIWAWTFAVAVGVTVILEKLTPNNDTVAGISFIVIGLVAVGLAAAYATARNEPDETVSTVSE